MQIHSFIANAFYQTDSKFIKYNPFTLENLHEVSSCDLMGVVMAVQAANKAFQNWKVSSMEERRDLVVKIQKHIEAHADEYARLEATDQALPLVAIKKYSIESALKSIESAKNQQPDNGQYQYSPVGVVVIVASWNLSLRIILDRMIPALMAGNSVVIKVSSMSVITAQILSETVSAVQAPPGLVNIIVSDDAEVKRALVSHPGVRAISFAGSLEIVTEILPLMTQASLQSFKKIQIGSGSKNSAVVLSEPTDENFNSVMESFLLGQGQLVWNSARLFILEKFEKEWQERIESYLKNLRPSEDIEDDSVWTPCLKEKSFLKFDEIKQQAIEDKAKLLQSSFELSETQKKSYLTPIFTKDMSRCSTLQQDQIHSPIYILSTVKYPFDVAKYSNVSYFGFAAHLWGEKEKLVKVAEALDVGLVTFNQASIQVSGAVSGVKQSGFGIQNYQNFGDFYSNVKKLT